MRKNMLHKSIATLICAISASLVIAQEGPEADLALQPVEPTSPSSEMISAESPVAPDATLSENVETLERLQNVLREAEENHNAFSPALAEAALSLGLHYSEMGFHEAAAQNLNRALSLEKINRGLYSPDNLPIYEILIDAKLNVGNSGEAFDLLSQYEWVVDNGYEENDPRQYPYKKNIALWHLSAYLEGIDEKDYSHLKKSYDLFRELHQQRDYSSDDDHSVEFGILYASKHFGEFVDQVYSNSGYRGTASGIVQFQNLNVSMLEELCERPLPRAPQNALNQSSSLASDFYFDSSGNRDDMSLIYMDQIRPYLSRCLNKLEDQQQDVVDTLIADADSFNPERLLSIADWLLLVGESEQASSVYARAHSQIDGAASPLITVRAITPASTMPALPKIVRNLSGNAGELELQFNLSSEGEVSELVILSSESDALSSDQIKNIKRWMERQTLRPGIDASGTQALVDFLCRWDIEQQQCKS